jgi:MoaA/NifB/PqqE/SkfB family radical SAM enzyme
MIPFQAMKPFFKGRVPGQLIIQYTNQCNADCPQCGMKRSAAIDRNTLPTDQVKQLIDSAAEKGFQALSLTGGEPLLHLDTLLELVDHARQAGISHVRTGTNGYIFQGSDKPDFEKRIHRIAEGISKSGLSSFWISLDSANPEDHETMRGLQGLIKGIEKGLPIFHAHNIYPSANLGINRNTGGKNPLLYQKNLESEVFFELFKEAFRKFYTFTLDLGFTTASACYPMSHEEEGTETEHAQGKSSQDISTYGATSTDRVIHFSPREKGLIFQALYETIPEFRSQLRIFTPLCSLYNLIRQYRDGKESLYSCHGGKDFFFIECGQGKIHPCGYLSDSFPELPNVHKRSHKKSDCNRCEWECFRDPSDLMGPFAELFTSPFKLLAKLVHNPQYYKILRKDLHYYGACNYFDGKLPPDYTKLQKFSKGL